MSKTFTFGEARKAIKNFKDTSIKTDTLEASFEKIIVSGGESDSCTFTTTVQEEIDFIDKYNK